MPDAAAPPGQTPVPDSRGVGERLVAEGRLTRDELERCLAAARAAKLPLEEILRRRGEIPDPATAPTAATPFEPTPSREADTEVGHATAASPSERVGRAIPAKIESFGNYEVGRELGRGGMGIVLHAYDKALRRPVAMKMILDPARARPDELKRFRREASAAAQLRHPGIVSVYEVGEHDGRPFLVMEFVDGKSLEELAREQPLPPKRAAELVREVALALEHAHGQGVVHRDVKPGNVLVDKDGRPHLTDFGLARSAGANEPLTRAGDVLGTPAYMAPEQAQGDVSAHGPRSDVYGLGAVLYRLVAGRPPFEAKSIESMLKKVLFDDPDPPRRVNPNLHQDLDTIALRCLAKEPSRRYATAAAVAEDLRRFIHGEPILARPVGSAERAWLWVRRNPRLAPLLAGLLVLATAAVLLSGWLVLDKRARRREVVAAIEEARGRSLVRGTGDYEAILSRLAGHREDQAVRVVAAALDEVSAQLRAVERELYLSTPEVPGLTDAVRRWDALAPGEELDPASTAVLHSAALAVEKREGARRPAAVQAYDPVFRDLVASAQGRRLEREGSHVAQLLCEALGRIGLGEEASPALARQLFAQQDELRAAVAADALLRVGGSEGLRLVLARRAQLGLGGTFSEQVAPLLRRLGVADLPGTTARERVERGLQRLVSGDADGAIAELTSAIALAPHDSGAWRARGRARQAKGEYGPALADCTRSLELEPGSVDGRIDRAAVRAQLGDRVGSEADFAAALETDPRRVGAFVERARARQSAREYEGALADCDRALELDARNAAAWIVRGACHRARGQLDLALGDIDRAIELNPTAAEAWSNRGELRFHRGDVAGALADIDKAIELHPRQPLFWVNRCNVRRLKGDVLGSIQDGTKALELDPGCVTAWANRGLARTEGGDLKGGREDLDKAIALAPGFAEAWVNRGTNRRAAGDLPGSIADLTSAIALAPKNVFAWFNRGNAKRMSRDADGAIADYTKAVELAPGFAEAWRGRGVVREQKGDLDGAIADQTKAIEANPKLAVAWNDRGSAKTTKGDLAGAIEDLTRSIELEPRNAFRWGLRAYARKTKGDLDGAIEDYTKALELDPTIPECLSGRAFSRMKKGDAKGAEEDFVLFLKKFPRHREAVGARAMLAKLRPTGRDDD